MVTKYFFANDRINYARIIPVHVFLAERSALKESDEKSTKNLSKETWEVDKNTEVLFCAVRVDIALGHIKRPMKVWRIYHP